MGHLNGFLGRVGGNLNNSFQKRQMPGGLPVGMLVLPIDRYIIKIILVQDFCPLKIKKTQFPVGFRLKFCYKIALKFR